MSSDVWIPIWRLFLPFRPCALRWTCSFSRRASCEKHSGGSSATVAILADSQAQHTLPGFGWISRQTRAFGVNSAFGSQFWECALLLLSRAEWGKVFYFVVSSLSKAFTRRRWQNETNGGSDKLASCWAAVEASRDWLTGADQKHAFHGARRGGPWLPVLLRKLLLLLFAARDSCGLTCAHAFLFCSCDTTFWDEMASSAMLCNTFFGLFCLYCLMLYATFYSMCTCVETSVWQLVIGVSVRIINSLWMESDTVSRFSASWLPLM